MKRRVSCFICTSVLLNGLLIKAIAHEGHDQDHAGHHHPRINSTQGFNIPHISVSAEGTLRSYLREIAQKSGTRIVAGLPISTLDTRVKITRSEGSMFELIDTLSDSLNFSYQVLLDVMLIRQRQSYIASGSARANLVAQLALSLTQEQLKKVNHTEAALAPSLSLKDLTPQQLQIAQKILKNYGPTFNGISADSFPPEAIRLRVRFELLAKLWISDSNYSFELAQSQPSDSQVLRQLQSPYTAENGDALIDLAKTEGSIAEFVPLVASSTSADKVVLDRSLENTNVLFTFDKVSKSRLQQYLSLATGTEVRQLNKLLFVSNSTPNFVNSLWSFADRFRQATGMDRIDMFPNLRGRVKRTPVSALSQGQQRILLNRFAEYKEVNEGWRSVSNADVLGRGQVEVVGNLEVGFTFVPIEGNDEMRQLVRSPMLTTHSIVTAEE